jgi:hypothetical protein
MRFAKITGVTLGLALAGLVMVPVAHAGLGSQKTELTFNRSIRIPDHKVLPAGTYWFQLLDTNLASDSVLIYNKNYTKVEATLLTIPTYRAKTRNRTEITLADRSDNRPPMLVKWFYPGREWGQEFVYSRKTEHRIRRDIAKNIVGTSYPSAG